MEKEGKGKVRYSEQWISHRERTHFQSYIADHFSYVFQRENNKVRRNYKILPADNQKQCLFPRCF